MKVGLLVIQAAVVTGVRNLPLVVQSLNFSGGAMSLSDGCEKMQVKKLSNEAFMPVRGSEHAAGFDLAR